MQNLGNGETIYAIVPSPRVSQERLTIESTRSLISLGTEKMLVDFGRSGWIAKAKAQPDKVKQVLQKVRTDGLRPTIDAVRSKLDTPIALGYCNVGRVAQVSPNGPYQVGDRVVSNGSHAEVVSVPHQLTAKIPDSVSDDAAAFTVVGAIGLQGIRLMQPTLGERIVVSGLGLIGLLAVQILRANGCQVLGIDFDSRKLKLAEQFGARTVNLGAGEDPVAAAEEWTGGAGVDGVLITASTKRDELIHQAATMCRKRGRIVLVGVIGLNLQRADFYEKELSFQVSCSYGPGRYEPNYEKKGLDYPIGFVRWTEQRNFQAVLELLASGRLQVAPLITHRFSFDQALDAYTAMSEPGALGILLDYGPPQGIDSPKFDRTITLEQPAAAEKSNSQVAKPASPAKVVPRSAGSLVVPASDSEQNETSTPLSPLGRDVGIAVIGAGNFTTRTLLPLLPDSGCRREVVVSSSGMSATHAAKKFGFRAVSTDFDSVLKNPEVDAVFITTPHHLHASMVCQALEANKHVFVEKPLALHEQELLQIEEALANHSDRLLMVGFNRRFSPHMAQWQQWSASVPRAKTLIMTVNSGALPANHWTQDPAVGGGRIVGEACHFIDLARFLAGHPITTYSAMAMPTGDGRLGDCASLQLGFSDGSLATIHYLANGSKDFPKERLEMFAGGKVLVCDNFRYSREIGGKRKFKSRSQNKGHAAGLQAFLAAIRDGGPRPIPTDQLLEVSRVAIEMAAEVTDQVQRASGQSSAG